MSRWTMSYFAVALVFLVAGETMMVAGYGYPAAPIEAPETLALVHIIVVGWLSLLMCGALLQFVPVLVARPLAGERLALPALVLITGGVSALIIGLAGLGTAFIAPLALAGGAILLIAGFLTVGAAYAATLFAARPLPLPALFVAVGLAALSAAMLLGGIFAFALSGFTENGSAITLLAGGLPLHAVFGLGGWLTFTTMGVSYRLLTMFLLAPELVRRTSRCVWMSGCFGLGAVTGAGFLVLAGSPGTTLLAVAGLAGFLTVGLYGADILAIYRARKRRDIELNSRVSIVAFVALIASALLLAGLVATNRLEEGVGALFYLVTFGWLTGLGLAQLYKIIPFLTWLEFYGPHIGRVHTPRVQDLVVERRALVWFWLFQATVAVATLALLFGQVSLFRLASLGQLVAILALIIQFARARLLKDVQAPLLPPAGSLRPNLFLPASVPRNPK